jgi:hypothetical protein
VTTRKHKHRPCPCGCGELADECTRPGSALNAFSIEGNPMTATPEYAVFSSDGSVISDGYRTLAEAERDAEDAREDFDATAYAAALAGTR